MARGPLSFNRSDAKRAVRAVTECGLPVRLVEFGRDRIAVYIGEPDAANGESKTNPWDEVCDGAGEGEKRAANPWDQAGKP